MAGVAAAVAATVGAVVTVGGNTKMTCGGATGVTTICPGKMVRGCCAPAATVPTGVAVRVGVGVGHGTPHVRVVATTGRQAAAGASTAAKQLSSILNRGPPSVQLRAVVTGQPAKTSEMGHGKRTRQGVGDGEGEGEGLDDAVCAAAGATMATARRSDAAATDAILDTIMEGGGEVDRKGGKRSAPTGRGA